MSLLSPAPTHDLLHLAQDGGAADTDDELKGVALQASWPHALDASALFDALTPPKNPQAHGSYHRFCSELPVDDLAPDELLSGLAWLVAEQGEVPDTFETLTDRLVSKALTDLDSNPHLAPLIVEYLHAGAGGRHRSTPGDQTIERVGALSEPARWLLVDALLQSPAATASNIFEISPFGSLRVVQRRDLAMLIERFDETTDPRVRDLLRELVGLLYHPDEPGHSDTVLSLGPQHPLATSVFSWCFEVVELASPRADELRTRWHEVHDTHWHDNRPPPPTDEEVNERIETLLDAFDGGDVDAYWQIHLVLTVDPGSAHYGNEENADITTLPRWRVLPENLKVDFRTVEVLTRRRTARRAGRR